MTSPPAWWCGLKSYAHIQFRHCRVVTTCVVVWIEITIFLPSSVLSMVTTCVVVWIEILKYLQISQFLKCHHLRGGVD